MTQMYSPGGQAIPSGLTGYGLQLWQSGYFDPPAAAAPPPPPANPFMYDLTSLGQSMNGGATQVAAAAPVAQPISMANMEAPTQAPFSPAQSSGLTLDAVNGYYRQNKHREITADEWNYWQNSGQDLAAVDRSTKDGTYQFNTQQLLNGNQAQGGWGDISQGLGANQGTNDYSQWQHFMGTDGTPLAAYREFAPGAYDQSAQQPTQGALTGYRVFKDPGDFGGTGFKGGTDSRMNGIGYDLLDANGNFVDKGAFAGWTDSGIGDALGVGSIFAMAAGGALAAGAAGGAGGAAAAGAGVGDAAGMAGSGAFLGSGAASGIGAWDAALAGAGAAGAGAGLTGAGFVGEGAASGVPAWDAALANAGTAGAGAGATGAASDLFPGEAPWTPTPGSTPLNFTTPPSVPSDLFPQEAPWTPTPNAQPLDFTPPTTPGMPPPANPNVAPEGMPPPANPNLSTPSTNPLNGLFPEGAPSWLGPLVTAAGGLLGSQGNQASQTQTQTLDPRLDAAVYGSGGLVPGVQGLLQQQSGQAQANAAQMNSVGSGLLGRPISSGGPVTMGEAPTMPTSQVAPNGVGQVQYNAPTTASNPYLGSMADDIQKRTSDLLGQNNNAIAGNSVMAGNMGGSRQGVAQGLAAGKAADTMQGQLAGLYGSAYENDANRALSRYGQDLGFYTNQRNTDAALRGQDLSTYDNAANRNLQKYGLDQSYATAGRQQDLAGATLGAGLLAQGQQAQWNPFQNAANIYGTLKTNNTTQSSNSGGGAQGVLGGLLGGAQFASNLGLFNGNGSTTSGWW